MSSTNKATETPRVRQSRAGRSSLFQRARLSFVRSGGDRGASADVLRGSRGSDFESKAKVIRGRGYSVGTCFGILSCGEEGVDRREAKKERFLLLKGSALFIFSDESDPAPKYAVKLEYMKTVLAEDGRTVLFETSLGDIEYKFTFENNDTAKLFVTAVSRASSDAETMIARKRLGHAGLIDKRKSVLYAEGIADKKVEDQPQTPIDAGQVLAGMTSTISGPY
mmetsp:Transcript_16205/g.23131  ORF Transcript_16205/g.23131 Transcript_16205/m.23131 type:complete len:223 (-) Transcript_16205:1448-2116(-)|eukprot:CAMPEP_0172421602 /NCGR_PEP_ID=MMETSP1064-20121228/7834_1 /TAXON_ID=202472 /ORGANISM="Aulacoseira subarctica , Strain CCAP 1002/5" /LENGTH=222 /DNA_ID=CAMNT_0013162083 /DNA_START=128 /DNA_END=796 /DNA_ORIENTATION=-